MEEKKSIKIKFSTILIIILILLAIVLGGLSYFFYNQSTTFKNAYLDAVNGLIDMTRSGRYPDAFYATIEDISTNQSVNGISVIKVKGLDINEERYRGEFSFDIILDNIGDNFKIEHNGEEIPFSNLKTGQTIAVYDYSNTSANSHTGSNDEGYLSVYKVVVLDDNL